MARFSALPLTMVDVTGAYDLARSLIRGAPDTPRSVTALRQSVLAGVLIACGHATGQHLLDTLLSGAQALRERISTHDDPIVRASGAHLLELSTGDLSGALIALHAELYPLVHAAQLSRDAQPDARQFDGAFAVACAAIPLRGPADPSGDTDGGRLLLAAVLHAAARRGVRPLDYVSDGTMQTLRWTLLNDPDDRVRRCAPVLHEQSTRRLTRLTSLVTPALHR